MKNKLSKLLINEEYDKLPFVSKHHIDKLYVDLSNMSIFHKAYNKNQINPIIIKELVSFCLWSSDFFNEENFVKLDEIIKITLEEIDKNETK